MMIEGVHAMDRWTVWIKNTCKIWGTYFASFLFPAIILWVSLWLNGVFPFGDKTILSTDLDGQYSAYLAYFQSVLQGENDFFYTFSKVLGGDFWSFGAYYLFSPFNLLLCLGGQADLPILVQVIVTLKLCCCGLTMNCFLQSRKKSNWTVVFSVCYALMGYNMVYFYHLMWLDGVILFPLIILGVDQLIDERHVYKYIFALCAALCCNYYIGYMICVAVVIYTLLRIGFSSKNEKVYVTFGRFVRASILAGCLAAFVLLPTALSLVGGKRSPMTDSPWERNWNAHDLLKAFLPLPLQRIDGVVWNPNAPLIYCTMLAVVLAFLFFFLPNVNRYKKIEYGILLLILFAMSLFYGSDTIWHAWNRPTGFPYRYSFILTFMILMVAYEAAIMINWKTAYSKWLSVIVVLLILGDMTWNAAYSLNAAQDAGAQSLASYQEKLAGVESRLRELPNTDDFYRIEKTYDVRLNDAMRYGYSGLSHFSSSDKTNVTEFMDRMGYTTNRGGAVNWSGYTGESTIVSDSLFALRYLLAEDDPGEPWVKLQQGVYENPYALPIASLFTSDIVNIEGDENPFELQNQIYGDKVLKRLEIIPSRQPESETSVYYEIKIDSSDALPVYLYLATEDRNGIMVSVNGGDKMPYKTSFQNGVLCLGEYSGGIITLCLESEQLDNLQIVPLVYQLDLKQFGSETEKIKTNAVAFTKQSSSYLIGSVTIKDGESGILLFSIPYDKGWSILLNGEKASAEEFLGALMGVRIGEGTYSMELRFRPRGWYVGVLVSVVTLVYLLAFEFGMRQRLRSISFLKRKEIR